MYYQPGMSEADQRKLGASLPAATRQQLITSALAALPPCMTTEVQHCAHDEWNKPIGANCQTISDGWIGDYDRMEAAYQALPGCKPGPSVPMLLGGGAALFALGLGLGLAVAK